jgi:hypothetical protein
MSNTYCPKRRIYALALQQLGELDRALRILRIVIKGDALDRELNLVLISLHKERGDLEAARTRLNALREHNKGDRELEELWRELQD